MAAPIHINTQPNARPPGDYLCSLKFPQFAFLCVLTGQLDRGSISINYSPGQLLLIPESFEAYLSDFRHFEIRREEVVDRILDDLIHACHPRNALIQGQFGFGDGLRMSVEARYSSTLADTSAVQ